MEKKNLNSLILVLVASLLGVFISCEKSNEILETKGQNTSLEIGSNIIKLRDDSTNIAGYVEVISPSSELNLQWNFPPECNVDTTSIQFNMSEGVCKIPVKWARKDNSGIYGPVSKAFDGGVLISAGNISKYVHLIWADKIDSTLINNEAATRSANVLPKAVDIILTPDEVNMDIVAGGSVSVDFSGTSTVAIDQHYVAVSTNIDKSKIPTMLTQPETIFLDWIDKTAPDRDFSTRVDFKAGNIVKTCYINYTVPFEEPLIWEFINSSSTDGSDLPATNATVSIMVKTNKPWSIESTTAEISVVPDYGTGIGIKTLTLHIKDNQGPDPRPVSVLVKSQGVLKEALAFNQLASNGTETVLEFISSNPEHGATIPSTGTNATIKVKTSVDWWIEINGSRTTFPAGAMGEKTGSITVPANTSSSNQIVSYMIGYNTTLVKSISYIQPAQGSDISGTLEYESSNLPVGTIPSNGGTYTFTFIGTYTGSVQIRTLLDGVEQTPGIAVTNKKPQITVPTNTGAARNVSFQYKQDNGNWIALPVSTNKVQDDGTGGGDTESLNYVNSNLPTGNIPATTTVYTFNFEGGYTGKLRVRSVDATTGEILFNGPIGTTHSPKVTVPANTATTIRNIKFQYRKIDISTAPWIDLPASTNRVQDANTDGETGTVRPGVLTPEGDLSEYGDNCSCKFEGDFTGTIIMRAKSGEQELARNTGKVNSTITVPIPKLGGMDGMDRTITFEYSLDGGNTWIPLGSKRQINEIFLPSGLQPVTEKIPVEGGEFSWNYRGTYSKEVKFEVATVEPDGTYNVLSLQSSHAARTFTYTVPANTGTQRAIGFRYKEETKENWTIIIVLLQDGVK